MVTLIGVFAAISTILMYIELPIPFMPPFLKIDLSGVPILIMGFMYGPLPAIYVTCIKDIIHMFSSQTGCVGLCVSKDLKHWEYREPVYYPRRFNGACECPDVFRMGDWYYLVFSGCTNLFGNYYIKCRAGESEWQIPDNHRLDARAFYAAKTAGNEKERYLFGWNPTKEENLFGCHCRGCGAGHPGWAV